MRVLHITPAFYPAWAYGGIPRCAYELCQALVQRGVAIEVWTTDAFDAEHRVVERHTMVEGIAVHYFPNLSNRLAYHRQLYLPRGFRAHVAHHLAAFDLVHIHSHRHALEVVGGRAARRSHRPYVVTAHGTAPPIERYVLLKRAIDRMGLDATLCAASACIAVSDAEVAHYVRVGVPRDRIHVIPNGVHLAAFAALPPAGELRRRIGFADRPLLLFLGKITPRKGLDVLLRALARLPPEVCLAVAGNFMMPEVPIHELVAALGIGDRVRFVGLLNGRDKLAAYVDADVVVYPAEHEIFGLVVCEALMCGAPAVVCNDSGCGALLTAAGGGLVVPPRDAEALAAALRRLLEDPALRADCVARGRAFVTANLGWERIAAQTLDLYQTVLRRGSAVQAPLPSPASTSASGGG